MLKSRTSLVAIALAATFATACSQTPAQMSPTGPSSIAVTSGNDVASTTAVDGDRSAAPVVDGDEIASWASSRGWATAADGLAVSGTGVVTAKSGMCPAVVLTILGVPVTVNTATTFTAPATCASLVSGATVTVTGLLTVSASGMSVVATNIALGSTPGPPPGPGPTVVKVEGTVASFTGTCPALTITLVGTGGVVVTSAATVFDPATVCAQIAVGKKIEAHGSRNATGQLVATKVELDDDDDTERGPGRKNKVGGEGTIGAVTGACPTLTLVITGHRVQTTAATVYSNGTCATLRPGTKVKVDAETQPDGSIIAEKIEIQKVPGRSISGDGTVSSVSGTCPALTMMVKGYPVRTSATTVFSGGTCASIKSGTKIDVTGVSDDTGVDASAVTIKK